MKTYGTLKSFWQLDRKTGKFKKITPEPKEKVARARHAKKRFKAYMAHV